MIKMMKQGKVYNRMTSLVVLLTCMNTTMIMMIVYVSWCLNNLENLYIKVRIKPGAHPKARA
ncbi:unnamed protein product [Linum tenue]|uniref:ATP synthase F0 subunit 8 n=1 Tax=Linum tenue TaxID=586396 RepID=A0AAV0HEF6_9ROSI|nr:unnamed protein product [Linum tenue]